MKRRPELVLTIDEVGQLVMLAALVDLSPDGTDPSLMALHYKAKSYVSVENGVVALSAHLSLGRS